MTDVESDDAQGSEPAWQDGIIDNAEDHRFELPIDAELSALTWYRIEDNRYILVHTEVPAEYSGQGLGSRLAHGIFERIKAKGMRAIAKCPFMSSYAARHPEYAQLLDG